MDNKEQKGFVVYGDIEETLDALTDEQAASLFRGMVKYFNTGEEPKFSGPLKLAFIPIRQQMDRDVNKYENKCKKNRESIQKYWDKVKAEQNTNEYERIQSNTNEYGKIRTYTNATNTNTKTKTNTNTKTNKDTNTNTTSDKTDGPAPLSSSLISYLNDKAGTNYNVTSKVVARIHELLNSGYTEADMKAVIDKKVYEWKDDNKMRGYLRPRTLFGDKFDEYAAAPIPIEIQERQETAEKIDKLKEERRGEAESLSKIIDSMAIIEGRPEGIRGHWDSYSELAEQKGIKEQNIKTIDNKLGRLVSN